MNNSKITYHLVGRLKMMMKQERRKKNNLEAEAQRGLVVFGEVGTE